MAAEYRCHPNVVVIRHGADWFVQQPASGKAARMTPEVMSMLEVFGSWRPARIFCERVASRLSTLEAERLLRQFVHAGFVQQKGPSSRDAGSSNAWEQWGPAVTLFHFGTKNVPRAADFVAGERWLRAKAKTDPPPPPTKCQPRQRYRKALLAPLKTGPFDELLKSRRTWREFGRRPLSFESLSVLLERTWAVQHEGRAPGQGPVVLKTSPSGGACHPLEAYVLARRVEGLGSGLYHFESHTRQLARIRHGASAADIARFLPGQPWFRSAHAIIFMTAVFGRTAWRYQTPRAYRGVLLEAGHFCQTFLLVATSLQLAPFCTQALADSPIERALGIDGVSEGVLYAAGVGTRPQRPFTPGLPRRFGNRV